MFRLAHISDIHLAPLPAVSLRQLLSKRITGYLNWQRNRKSKLDHETLDGLLSHLERKGADHLAITGDLINLALPKEFTNARDWLNRLGNQDAISVILGNHDCYTSNGYSDACMAWGRFMGEDEPIADDIVFPYLRYRGEVALIGANSGVVTPPFMATGLFDNAQGERLRVALDDARAAQKFRVVMIHHPPVEGATGWMKKLHGQTLFRFIIAETGAELVLHGHTHVDSLNWIDGVDGPVPIVGVPSASQARRTSGSSVQKHNRPPARYNLFDIDGHPGKWVCHFTQFGYLQSKPEIVQIGDPIQL